MADVIGEIHFLCPAEIIELDTKKRFWAGWVMLRREDGVIRTEGLLDSPHGTLRPIDLPARTELRIQIDQGRPQ